MGCCSVQLSLSNLILLGVIVWTARKLISLLQGWRMEKMLEKWDRAPRDKLILHTVWRCKTMPSLSPFALKLETYLRMAKIPYELDHKDATGPKGKLPWITYQGVHLADSHLIIQFLNKKLNLNLNRGFSVEVLGAARACRILLEDHFLWGMLHYRWVENPSSLSSLMKTPHIFKIYVPYHSWELRNRMISQGIGKHEPREIYEMTEDDLRTISALLGTKSYMGGDEPVEDDCAIFGGLAQAVWGTPGSSFERLVNGELHNLKEYCERMKERYWPDWEECKDRS